MDLTLEDDLDRPGHVERVIRRLACARVRSLLRCARDFVRARDDVKAVVFIERSE